MTDEMISAWKSNGDGTISPCGMDDCEAVSFDVSYAGSDQGHYLRFTNLYEAKWAAIALRSSFNAGKEQAMADLRQFIGVK